MSAETERFRELMAEKAAAKAQAFEAMQYALWLDADPALRSKDPPVPEWLKGKTSAQCWALLDEYGMQGTEGEKFREAEQLATDTVLAHPAWFAAFDGKTIEQVVGLVDAYRGLGLAEDETLATMFELAKWERQNIGGQFEARVRLPGLGGKS